MRLVATNVLAVIAILAAGGQPGQAQESFFNKRFCTMGGGSLGSGVADCSFNTWEQCRASASGLGRYCSENPHWRPEPTSRDRARGTRSNRPER